MAVRTVNDARLGERCPALGAEAGDHELVVLGAIRLLSGERVRGGNSNEQEPPKADKRTTLKHGVFRFGTRN
jgi:hypothetical protein